MSQQQKLWHEETEKKKKELKDSVDTENKLRNAQ